MKISKAALAGMIVLSMMGLSACSTVSFNINDNSSVVSSTNTNITESNSTSGDNNIVTNSEKLESKSDTSINGNDEAQPNAYGYFEVINPPASSISVASLEGSWLDMGIGTEVLTVNAGSDLYNGNFSFRNDEGKITTGYIKLEQDKDNTIMYTFYEDDGTLWNAFVANGSIPLNDLTSVLDGGMNFKRQDDEIVENVVSIEAYDGTYIEETAGRGVITLSVDPSKNCFFHVTWPVSANETAEWDFSCSYDDNGGFPYENAVKTVTTYDENGDSTVNEEYTNGAGCIIVSARDDNTYVFTWNDEMEKIADGCVFVKQ